MSDGEMLVVAPQRSAGADEELRHLLVVEIFPDAEARRRAQRIEDRGDLFLLDQLSRLLDRLGRAVGIVDADQLILRPLMPPWSLIILK